MATTRKSRKAPKATVQEPVVATPVEAVVEAPVVEKPEAVDSSERDLVASGGYFAGGRFYLPIGKILGTADYISKAKNRRTYAIFRVDTQGVTLLPISKSGKVAHSDIRKVGRATYVGFRVSADRLVPGTVKMK
jgi:hypothetical protein